MADENGGPTLEEQLAQMQQERQQMADQLKAANLQNWRSAAVHEHPALASFQDLIVGDTEEAVKESAKQLSERFSQAFTPQQQQAPQQQQQAPQGAQATFNQLAQQAQALYGPQGGNNGVPVPPPVPPELELENTVRNSLRQHGTGIKRDSAPKEGKPTKQQMEQFTGMAGERIMRDVSITNGHTPPRRGETWRNVFTNQLIKDGVVVGQAAQAIAE